MVVVGAEGVVHLGVLGGRAGGAVDRCEIHVLSLHEVWGEFQGKIRRCSSTSVVTNYPEIVLVACYVLKPAWRQSNTSPQSRSWSCRKIRLSKEPHRIVTCWPARSLGPRLSATTRLRFRGVVSSSSSSSFTAPLCAGPAPPALSALLPNGDACSGLAIPAFAGPLLRRLIGDRGGAPFSYTLGRPLGRFGCSGFGFGWILGRPGPRFGGDSISASSMPGDPPSESERIARFLLPPPGLRPRFGGPKSGEDCNGESSRSPGASGRFSVTLRRGPSFTAVGAGASGGASGG